MKSKYTKAQQLEFIQAMGEAAVKNQIITQEVLDAFKIEEGDSAKTKAEKYTGIFRAIEIKDSNFILENHLNMIRTQTYLMIQGAQLADSKFNFWKSDKGNGEYIIIEDLPKATPRTGDVATDFANITEAPAVENALLMYLTNQAVDLPSNPELEKWATLEGATSWVNERLQLAIAALDYPLSTFLKDEINAYTGFANVLVDNTGLTDKESAEALQKAIGKTILTISNDYRKIYNEELTTGTGDNFTYRIDKEDIGIIFDTEAEINNEIDYLRNQYKNFDGATNNYPKDWGVGEIVNMDLNEGEEVKIIPKHKFKWGAQFGSGTTPLYFSLQELRTDYVFYGSVWLKAFPGITLSYGTVETLRASLTEKVKAQTEQYKLIKAEIQNTKDAPGIRQWQVKKSTALRDLQDAITRLESDDYIEKIIKAATVYKGSKLLDKPVVENVKIEAADKTAEETAEATATATSSKK